jgi:hypothetical protein
MASIEQKIVSSQTKVESRIKRIIQDLLECDIEAREDELIIRGAKELLLIREYRDTLLESLKQEARNKLKQNPNDNK